ncbi:6765_t:CDS:2 [Ambispora leptoticha]|uniref:6765_t:CDS:1 n=1 Tax=Ambispora leptoticha TaxID=144679 RepID=A0A9N9BG23_9GLOM|nr:6765_t:CDS:2 [Ambispora leptoticha]
MRNIIILEGTKSDFEIALQPESIKSIHNTSFNGYQCKEKFMNPVRDYNGIEEHEEAERVSNRRQCRIGGNNTPAPSTREVEHELGQILPGNRRSRRTSIDSRRSRRRSASSSPPRDIINANTNNPGVENPEQNIGYAGSTETSSLQPPPYEATDGAQNNSSEINQGHVVSSHEVAVSGNNLTPNLLNTFLSQNDSDVSMHDVGSQPLE